MVIVRRYIMITWLLLFSLFCASTQDNSGQENGVLHCGPQNVTAARSGQMILLTWEDEPSCSALRDVLVYELVVLIADERVHERHEEIAVMPDQIGSTHSWNWTSHLPLECTSHSIRLRSRYQNLTSPWKQQQTLPKTGNSPDVFPKSQMFKVGSAVTFCCILPAGQSLKQMELTNAFNYSNMYTTKISNRSYALTVTPNQATPGSCANVLCKTNKSVNGSCAYFGYPPGDKDLQCETRNLQSVVCHWTVGGNTGVSLHSPTEYYLLGRKLETGSVGRFEMKVQIDAVEKNWTLTAQNILGKVELSDSADLMKRVHMIAPTRVKASTENSRNATLEWKWTVQQYKNLNITCQINVSHGETNTTSEHFGVGLQSAFLDDLIPHWSYNVTIRCGTTPHFWKWSEWSTRTNFHTKGEVPDALDVWMQVDGSQTIITWKMLLANQSHGHITHYEVTWPNTTDREQKHTTKVHNKHTHLALNLDTTEEYVVTVTAWNRNGSSSPSTITIPSLSAGTKLTERMSRIIGSDGGFNLSWAARPTASCGYIVDWCPTVEPCTVEWLKVPPNTTSASIFSKRFEDGKRYTLSVYACTHGAPELLERREGYVREQIIKDGLFAPLEWKQMGSDVELSWKPLNFKNQTAFIQGYVVYCLDNNGQVIQVSTDNNMTTSLTVENLSITTYNFTLKANTTVGECGTTSVTVTLNSLTDNLVKLVLISLVTIFSLLSLITILCYRHWACIKQKVYPPIPEPMLIDKWWTSPSEKTCPPSMDQAQDNEADIVTVTELHRCSLTQESGYVGQEDTPFGFAQTPKGYINQQLKKSTEPTPSLPSTNIHPSLQPSSHCRSLIFNPSYNLIMQTGDEWDEQPSSSPDLQENTALERCSTGYQPQNDTKVFTVNQKTAASESPMFCDSAYISLPDSSSQ